MSQTLKLHYSFYTVLYTSTHFEELQVKNSSKFQSLKFISSSRFTIIQKGKTNCTQSEKHQILSTLITYLNLGFSTVTTPTSISEGLKSMDSTVDRHVIAV